MNLGTSTPANFSTITSNIFVECWVYSSLAYNPNFITWHQGAVGGQENWSLYFNTSGRLIASIWGQVSGTATNVSPGVSSAIGLNTWTHVGFAISNTASVYTIYIYVNGTPTSTSTPANWTPQFTSTGITQIGGRNTTNDTTNMYIRDLRVVQGGIVPTGTFVPSAAPFSYALPSYVTGAGSVVFTLLGQFITYVPGKYNQAISIGNFPGGSPTSNVSWALPSLSSSALSVSVWVNASAFSSSNSSQFVSLSALNPESDLRLYFNSGTTTATIGVVYPFVLGSYIGRTSSAFSTGTWIHVVATVTESTTSSNVISSYINGVFIGSSSSATSIPRTFNKLTIASFCDGLFQSAFNGVIDDLRVYNTVLTASQVQSIYSQGGAPASQFRVMPQPSLAWSFDGTTTDYMKGLTGTTTGTVSYSAGKYGQGVSIVNPGGVLSNYVSYTLTTTYTYSQGVSFGFWVNFNDLSAIAITQVLLAIQGSVFSTTPSISLNGGKLITVVWDGTATYHSVIYNTPPVTGVWYHLMTTIGAGNITFYVNGVSAGSTVYTTTPDVSLGTTARIGTYVNQTSPLYGATFDDLRIYSSALTATQVNAIYQAQGMPGRGVLMNARVYSPGYITSATGGNTIVDFGGYRIHTFTTTGSSTFTPSAQGVVDVLVVAGGGGGGGNDGGGGSGGQVQYSSSFSISGAISVTVGSGGTAGGTGGSSSFGSITSIGGGGGGAGFTGVAGNSSAYGGGSGGSNTVNGTVPGPIGTVSYKGGDGFSSTTFGQHAGGGGGGAGGSGVNASSQQGGNGGPGLYYSISGYNTGYGGGGGGGVYISLSSPSNGKGTEGGGNGGYYLNGQVQGTNGTPNTGGGGGSGADGGSQGRVGGSGIVIVRYPTPKLMTGTPLFSQLSASAIASSVGAFSLRAVNGTTAKAVQIKRQSDNATQDFYADRLGNLLTVPVTGQTLANWLVGSTGNIVTWYNQTSLTSNNMTQATAASQPIISSTYMLFGNPSPTGTSFVNAYIDIGNINGSYTKSVWVYPNNTASGRLISSTPNLPSGRGYHDFGLVTNLGIYFGQNNYTWYTNSTISLNTWTHLVATYDNPNQTVRIYVNSVNTLSNVAWTTSFNSGDGLVDQTRIGRGNGGNTFGYIEYPVIFNTVLSQTDINTLYVTRP
jgi:hypothetical protein